MKAINEDNRYAYASDYAVMNGAWLSNQKRGLENRKTTWHCLRSATSRYYVDEVIHDGSLNCYFADIKIAGLCPALHLNLSSVISARSASCDFKIEPFKDKSGNILYHTIEFGSYPQDKARNSSELEKLYNAHKLTPTGKTYTGYMKEDGSFKQNQEFEYDGKKYVRVLTKRYDSHSEYSDGTMAPESGTYMWTQVEPIVWKIRNWDEMPTSINPKGNGKAKSIDIRTEEAIMSGIPFYPSYGKKEYTMWQNSVLRAFLNGYDLHEELSKENGNKEYKSDINFNFKGKGFLQEAFNGISLQLEAQDEVIKEASDISLISMEEFISAAKSNGVKEAIEHASEELISENDKEKYIDFLSGKTNLDTLLENTNLADNFKHNIVLTLAEHKMLKEFEKICDERGIKIDDDIPKSIEDTFKEKMAETTATIEFKAEEDNKEAIKAIQNIKI